MLNDMKSLINKGIELIEKEQYSEALIIFEEKLAFTKDPTAMSYYALCLAVVEKNFEHAMSLSMMAIKRDDKNPVMYLNLGKIFILNDQKTLAIRVFMKGLRLDKRHEELIQEIKKVGIRRSPVLNFLPRNNIVNRIFGKLTYSWQMKVSGGAITSFMISNNNRN